MLSDPLFRLHVLRDCATALAEDLPAGDPTAALIRESTRATATVLNREPALLCGRPWFEACFRALDPEIQITWTHAEGAWLAGNTVFCTLHGQARALLSAERTALNFLQTLSATATQTRRLVDLVAGTPARILDTRKTLPGLRFAQKYAVRVGGGANQRADLSSGMLIKENHIAAAGGIRPVLVLAQASAQNLPLQIEVENLAELQEALEAGARLILLDNFSPEEARAAVDAAQGRAELEVSGGINEENIRAYAESGIDRISIGGITKNIRAIDLSMRIDLQSATIPSV